MIIIEIWNVVRARVQKPKEPQKALETSKIVQNVSK